MKILKRLPLAAAASILLAWAAVSPCAAVDSAEQGPRIAPVAAVPAPVSGVLPSASAGGTELSLPPALTGPAAPESTRLENPAAQPAAGAVQSEAGQAAPAAQAASEASPSVQAQAAPSAKAADEKARAPASAQQQPAAEPIAAQAQAAAAPSASAEQASVSGGKLFDGLKARAASALAPLAARTAGSPFAHLLPNSVVSRLVEAGKGGNAPPAPPKPPRRDDFGGPLPAPSASTFKGRLGYGLKIGGILLGVSTLLQLVLGPILGASAWQLHVGPGILQMMGRVELLTDWGPSRIAHALQLAPLRFLGLALPFAVVKEEIVFRGIQLLMWFVPLAIARPAGALAAGLLEKVPDLYGARTVAQRLLCFTGHTASKLAFPIAAVMTSFGFATAHFATWGANPFLVATHFTLGLGLAYAAYRTRSLVAPMAAHFTVNAVPLAGVAIAMALGSALFAQIYGLALAIGSLVFLYIAIRPKLKLRLLRGLLPLVLIAALVGGVMAPRSSQAPAGAPHGAVTQVQQPQQNGAAVVGDAKDAAAAEPQNNGPVAPDMTERQVNDMAKPSVVMITVKMQMGMAIGSGFIVSKDGLLVTNAHVVSGAGLGGIVKITLSDEQTEVPGKVVAINKDRDIALVQLPKMKKADGTVVDWPFLKVGDVSTIHEGDHVVALGHPLGLPYSISHGIISGVGHRGSIYVQEDQTDAAINHGNSGGPLLNMRGEVIGINSSIASPTAESGSIGIGFAITAEGINAALAQYAASGNIDSANLGIIADMGSPAAPPRGILIEAVRPGSAAAKAGLKAGDLLLGANKRYFGPGKAGVQQLARIIARSKPGDELSLAVVRDGDKAFVTLKLGDKKP